MRTQQRLAQLVEGAESSGYTEAVLAWCEGGRPVTFRVVRAISRLAEQAATAEDRAELERIAAELADMCDPPVRLDDKLARQVESLGTPWRFRRAFDPDLPPPHLAPLELTPDEIEELRAELRKVADRAARCLDALGASPDGGEARP